MPDLAAAGLSATMEDYLEAIYRLQETQRVARVRDIAQQLGVKMPSVSSALKALAGRQLIEHEAYGYVTLTEQGRQLAEQVHQRHVAIVELLQRVMGLPAEQAELEACRLEHALSREALERLQVLTQFILHNPHIQEDWRKHIEQARLCEGVAPPALEGVAKAPEATLDCVPPGCLAVIVRICGEGPIRRRLLDMGLRPGVSVRVERLAPLGDPIELYVMDYHLTLRRSEAANITVRLIEFPLSQALPGSRVRVEAIHGGIGRKRRLAELGLQPGQQALVLPSSIRAGHIALEINGQYVEIGARMAEDVFVRLMEE